MAVVTYSLPANFDLADPNFGDWWPRIFAAQANFTTVSYQSNLWTVQGTAASGFPGWTVEVFGNFTAAPGPNGFPTGQMTRIDVYNGSAQLLLTMTTAGQPSILQSNPAGVFNNVTFNGSSSADYFGGSVFADVLNGGGGNDTLKGGNLNDALDGGADNDTLYGGQGNDTLNGGVGGDYMEGGVGDDIYYISAAADVVVEAAAAGTDRIVLESVTYDAASYTLAANVENLTVSGAGAGLTANGNALFNTITAGSGGAIVFAAGGNDGVTGGTGADSLNGEDGDDFLNGADGADTLTGGIGADTLYGGFADDTIDGGAGDDLIVRESQGGADVVAGGEGIDTLSLIFGGNTIDLRITGPQAVPGGSLIISGIEALKSGGGNDLFYGSDNADRFLVNAGDEVHGNGGDDLVISDFGAPRGTGGAGYDTYRILFGYSATVSLDGRSVNGAIPISGFERIEHFGEGAVYGGPNNDYIVIEAGDGIIFQNSTADGGGGDDTIEGRAGASALGGDGNDLFLGSIDARGGDSFVGILSQNKFQGDAGSDTVDYAYSALAVTVDLAIQDRYQTVALNDNDFLYLIENVSGSAFTDILFGDGQANRLQGRADNDRLEGKDGDDWLEGGAGLDRLFGGANNDILDGGADADLMVGGLGDDTYYVDSSSDTVTENPGEGRDVLYLSVDRVIDQSIEEIRLQGGATTLVTPSENTVAYGTAGDTLMLMGSGFDAAYGGAGGDSLYGEDGNDALYGEADPDSLLGGAGADQLDGGFGADLLIGGDDGDLARGGTEGDFLYGDGGADVLYGDDGADLLTGGLDSDQLYGGAGIDGLYGQEGADYMDAGADADTVFGGEGNDVASGGSGADLVSGDAGDDTLYGDADNDTLYGDIGADTVSGGDGADGVYGQHGDDVLNGGSGDDLVSGGDGADIIRGSTGADQLYGGSGADRFVYDAAYDSTPSGIDTIADFETGVDKLDLTALNTGGATLSTAVYGGSTFVYVDANGDGAPDFVVVASGVTLTGGDILF